MIRRFRRWLRSFQLTPDERFQRSRELDPLYQENRWFFG